MSEPHEEVDRGRSSSEPHEVVDGLFIILATSEPHEEVDGGRSTSEPHDVIDGLLFVGFFVSFVNFIVVVSE